MAPAVSPSPAIRLSKPNQQVNFAEALIVARELFLMDALLKTVSALNLKEIDAELHKFAGAKSLAALAAHGLRGELAFAVPLILEANPRLLAYYRLMLGYSQKEFYGTSGIGSFKSAEDRGEFAGRDAGRVPDLCTALASASGYLVANLPFKKLSAGVLDDLTLLTYGPQLRGGANVKRGVAANELVFQVIREIVVEAIVEQDSNRLTLNNASGRKVEISFSSDPDIKIVEVLDSAAPHNIIAIEIKGGTDYSNIHNRIGEAEKSHQKARKAGFAQCWTIVNVEGLDMDMAQRESPSTNRFYKLPDLTSRTGPDYSDFAARIAALTGIKKTEKSK